MPTFVLDRSVRGVTAHSYSDGRLFANRGFSMMTTIDLGASWRTIGTLPVGSRAGLVSTVRLSERALRLACSNIRETPAGTIVAIADRSIFRKGVGDDQFHLVHRIEFGSRPLHRGLCITREGRVLWGEYHGNPNRLPLRVFASDDDAQSFQTAFTFQAGEAKHIHAVQQDPYTGDIWILTGDDDAESALYRGSIELQNMERVSGGAQVWRSLNLIFTPGSVCWGTDSPDEQNFIVKWDRSTQHLERLQAVGGPVYYAARNEAGMVFFATAAEPGSHASPSAEVWASSDGDLFERIGTYPKDRWHPRLFQFGVILMPDGTLPGNSLILAGTALRGLDDRVLIGRVVY